MKLAGLIHRVEAQFPDPVRQPDILIHMAVPQRRQGMADGRQIAFGGHADRSAGVRARVGDGETDAHPAAGKPAPRTRTTKRGAVPVLSNRPPPRVGQLLERMQQDTPFGARQRAGLFKRMRNHGIGTLTEERP